PAVAEVADQQVAAEGAEVGRRAGDTPRRVELTCPQKSEYVGPRGPDCALNGAIGSRGAYDAVAGAGSDASARRVRTSSEAPTPRSSVMQPVRTIRWNPLTKAGLAAFASGWLPPAARRPEEATAAEIALPW